MRALAGGPGATFDWPTRPETKIGLTLGGGLSYRFAPNHIRLA